MVAHHGQWIERYLEAQRHVVSGRNVVKRQRALIARKRAEGRNTEESENLLATFERTQLSSKTI
jgi:hypothetical protein